MKLFKSKIGLVLLIFSLYFIPAINDYILENRIKAEISSSFRQLLELPKEDILPLTTDEKRSVHRFYLAFLRHENISPQSEVNESTAELFMDDMRNLLKGMQKEQLLRFLKQVDMESSPVNSSTEVTRNNDSTENVTRTNETKNITTQKKSEIIKDSDDQNEFIDPKTVDNIIDDLTVSSEDYFPQQLYKRKEIINNNLEVSTLSNTDSLDAHVEKNIQFSDKKIGDELFNLLAKEGWKEYQKISKNEVEPELESLNKTMNYLHWNFEKYDGRSVLGSPGNPLVAYGNLLYNKGSATFLEDYGGFLNGGDYKDYCISDPSKCLNGFSVQLTVKINNIPSTTQDNQLFLIDTGASSPDARGFSIFILPNDTLAVHVANGEHNWCASKSLAKAFLNKWLSVIVIFDSQEGISIILNCKEVILSVPYGKCTPCLNCHQTDKKTILTIGRPNNIDQNYITLPMVLSDLEIYFYPLNQTKIFEKCGIMEEGLHSTKKNTIVSDFYVPNNPYYQPNSYFFGKGTNVHYPYINPC